MAANPVNAVGAVPAPAQALPDKTMTDQTVTDDVIDLRRYLNVLAIWWKEIVLIALLLAVVAGGAYWLLNASETLFYAAAADVAIVRTVSDVTFDERFTTQPETVAASNTASRRNALLALATNPAMAAGVIEQLGEALPEALREPAQLAEYVGASLATANGARGDSDLIRITARASSADVAAQIATAWAQHYVETVNRVYGQVPDELLGSIEQELAVSESNYSTAQAALEEFTARSRIDELTRQIGDVEQTLNALRRGRISTLTTLIDRTVDGRDRAATAITTARADNIAAPYTSEQEGRRAILLAYIDALYTGQAQVISEQAQRDRDLLSGYYTRWLQITRSLQEAEALRGQVAAGSEENAAGSDALVLALLKLQAYTQALDPQDAQQLDVVAEPDVRINAQATNETSAAASPGMVQSTQPVQVQVGATPLQLQLDDKSTPTRAALLADIDALTAALEARRTTLEGQIADLGARIQSGEGYENLTPGSLEGSALAQAIQTQAPAILGSTVLTGTDFAAGGAAASAGSAELASLFRLDDLTALADATTDDEPLLDTMAAMEEKVRSLKVQLESERAQQTNLTQQRDITLDAYHTVSSKIAELTLSRAAASSEVRFAAPAVPAVEPVATLSPWIVAAAAALAGLGLGVIVAFVADYMGRRPFLSAGRRSTAQAA